MNHDPASGYFDYTKFSVSEQLRYRAKSWEFSVEGKVSRYEYGVQTVSANSLEKRNRTEMNITLQAEWQFTRSFRLVGAYEYERALSNISIENYDVSTISGSLQWSF